MIILAKLNKRPLRIILAILLCLALFLALDAAPAHGVSGEDIVLEAEKYLGYPYAWSAAGPNAFDCGGFTWYIYDQLGIDFGLRVSSAKLAGQGQSIEKAEDLQLGDIVFFGYGKAAISHWGIYSGYGYVIHSYNYSTGVVEMALDAVSPPFCYGVRLNELPAYDEQAQLLGEPSDWAAGEVAMAISAGLIPLAGQGSYQQEMTRGEFCSLLLDICEQVFGQSRRELLASRGLSIDHAVFRDTRQEDILIAQALGLVNGRPDGSFGPDEPLSRETAALLLSRLLALAGKSGVYDPGQNLAALADTAVWYEAGLAAWGAIGLAAGLALQQPVLPLTDLPLTREQAFVGVMRLYRYLVVPETPGLEEKPPQPVVPETLGLEENAPLLYGAG